MQMRAARNDLSSRIMTGGSPMCLHGAVLNPLTPCGNYTYHQFNTHKLYVLPHTAYLCVLCGSQDKQRLFPYTALTDWFV